MTVSHLYNERRCSYNRTVTALGQPMKVSRNGQVSIPAAVRARWQVDEVIVVDLGDHLVVGPRVEDPIGAYRGWLQESTGASTDQMRREDRLDEEARDLRKYGHA